MTIEMTNALIYRFPTTEATRPAKKNTRLIQDEISISHIIFRPSDTCETKIANFHFGACHTQIKLSRTEMNRQATATDKKSSLGDPRPGFRPNKLTRTSDPVTIDVNHLRTATLSSSHFTIGSLFASQMRPIGGNGVHNSLQERSPVDDRRLDMM